LLSHSLLAKWGLVESPPNGWEWFSPPLQVYMGLAELLQKKKKKPNCGVAKPLPVAFFSYEFFRFFILFYFYLIKYIFVI
jgi:hypothetical protein